MSDDEKMDVGGSIDDETVLTKYRLAADIANAALGAVVKAALPGKSVAELCQMGDEHVKNAVAPLFTKGNIPKGSAFPTCVCVNNIVCAYSPLTEEAPEVLKEGDLVKIDLGVHIDGYPALVAHTFLCSATPGTAASGRAGDVLVAAHQAMEASLRVMRPGNKGSDVTAVIAKVCKDFNVTPIDGNLSHNMSRNVVSGPKVILTRGDQPEHRAEEFEFAQNEVYHLDIALSTGEGKPREHGSRTTVFRRADENYTLKMKSSREFISTVNKTYGRFPFSMRWFTDKGARLGLTECVRHDLLHPYICVAEKPGDMVARFQVSPSGGVSRVTGLGAPLATSSLALVDADVKALLSQPLKPKKKAAEKMEIA